MTPLYKSRHLIQTQYMTVVLKCDDLSCCSKARTEIKKFFPDRRLPALIPIQFTPSGPQHLELVPEVWKKQLKFPDFFARRALENSFVPETLKLKFGDKVPYDAFFPTLQTKVMGRCVTLVNCIVFTFFIIRRVCSYCRQYFSTIKSLTEHKRVCRKRKEPNGKRVGAKKQAVGAKKQAPVVEFIDDNEASSESEEGSEHNLDQENTTDLTAAA